MLKALLILQSSDCGWAFAVANAVMLVKLDFLVVRIDLELKINHAPMLELET